MGLGRVISTLGKDPGPAIKKVIDTVRAHPVASTLGAGALVAAGTAFGQKATEQESEFMKNRLGSPDAKFVYASEKVAAFLTENVVRESSSIKLGGPNWNTMWSKGLEGMGSGIGGGVGLIGMSMLAELLRKAGQGFTQKLKYDTQRKELLRTIVESDPIISSFEVQNPGVMLRVYASMISVAPKLSLDHNVVTTFLREAAQTHGAVNYMTLKQLAEAEHAVNQSTGEDVSRIGTRM